MKKTTLNLIFLFGGGFAAGFANGLLGAGGGVIVIFTLSKLLGDRISDKRDLYANALCVIFVLSLVSLVIYVTKGRIDTVGFSPYVLPSLVGGVIGAILLGKIKTAALQRLFAGLIVYSGIMLMVR